MNEHLVKEWQRCVRPGDTVVCPGDIGHQNAWRDRHLGPQHPELPGNRFLVLRNHDRDRDALREAGQLTTQCTLALCATDPPLALSHVRLWAVRRAHNQRTRATSMAAITIRYSAALAWR